ncbi:Kef-type K+ transport system membrane component KefB [Crossiella equi]|uniref:Kef-type K+ transport system membrane component KefB n=1 Tax=Crossiella equi TaxID=130796 RepID=A0ABS5AT15_9PSEU|nr:cation:proton antiporter [Crossiella equi]MBP2479719.1 Kef-type K+ transport system membrane component KefB [Crossiella equi]
MSTHQITFLLADIALVIVLARLLGTAARKLGQPPVIGELVAGILLGPTLFGAEFAAAVFPEDVRPFLAAIANLGVALFMAMVGMELDHGLLRGRSKAAISVSVCSVVLPFGLGVCLALYLARHHTTSSGPGFLLFMGVAISVTAFPVLARILTDHGLRDTPEGGLALVSAAVGDVLAWSALAVVIAVASGTGETGWTVLLFLPYLATMLWVVRPLLRKLITPRTRLGPGLFTAVFAGVLISGAVTEWLGLHTIFGAFLFGAMLPQRHTTRLREDLSDRLGSVNGTLLLPVFFVVAGLQVDLTTIGLLGLGDLTLVLAVAITGKFAGAYLGARLYRLSGWQSSVLAVLMNTRGLTELIVLSVGRQYNLIDANLYTILVLMALTTTAMTGPLLHLLYRRDRTPAHLPTPNAR